MRIISLVAEKNFRVVLVEMGDVVGFIVEYRNRRIYLPPVIGDYKVPLPKKYARFFDPIVFPEITAVPYGRRG